MSKTPYRICIPLAKPYPQDLIEIANNLIEGADLLELRLDALKEPDSVNPALLVSSISLPVILTIRSKKEGGWYEGSEDKRALLIEKAIVARPKLVDIELSTNKELRADLLKTAKKTGTKLILSFHNFSFTPPLDALLKILDQACQEGADVVKIVTMAKDYSDLKTILSLYAMRPDVALIAFCMGDIGRFSRVACLPLGAYLTFVALNEQEGTAPGQICLKEMRRLIAFLSGSSSTLLVPFSC